MRNLAIIPARSGSKGLKDKNIRNLNGIPLIGYSINAAKESGLFTEIMVSTDSEKYAQIAISLGAEVPFIRSEKNSSDTASSNDMMLEVLNCYKLRDDVFDTICLLQPTSPLRDASDIIGAYKLYEEKKANAITSVCEVEHSPKWNMILDKSLSMTEFRAGMNSVPRQLLQKFYRLNGAIYIRGIDYLRDNKIVIKDDCEYAYVMDRKKSVDIDSIDDFEYAEFLISKIKNW